MAKRDFSAKSGTPLRGLPYITFTQRSRVRGGVQKVSQIGDAKYTVNLRINGNLTIL